MAAFFSGTDIKELEDNAENYFFYVSLVVNTSDRYACKVIIPSTTKTVSEHSVKDSFGAVKLISREETERQFLDGDLDIVFEVIDSVDSWAVERFKQVKENKEKEAEQKKYSSNPNFIPSYGYGAGTSYYGKGYQNPWQDSRERGELKVSKPIGTPLDFARAILSLDTKNYKPLENLMKTLESLSEDNFSEYLILLADLLYELCDEIWNDDDYEMYTVRINQAIAVLEKHSTDKTINLKALITFLKSITDNTTDNE